MSGITMLVLGLVALVWLTLFVGFTGFVRLTKKGIDPTAEQPYDAANEGQKTV